VTRAEYVLAALHASGRAEFSPVQIQKLFFLIDENVASRLGGKKFNFEPYNYGPFDRSVYLELDSLCSQGLVECIAEAPVRTYRLTTTGVEKSAPLFQSFEPEVKSYIDQASTFVRSLSFTQLVSAIYKAYPSMRANSVFQD